MMFWILVGCVVCSAYSFSDGKAAADLGKPVRFLQQQGSRLRSKACLSFMHIPKTAGTSIETVGWRAGQRWGYPRMILTDVHCRRDWHGSGAHCILPDGASKCSKWHTPPALDPEIAKFYSACDTFCVVRDPLDRFRSEYAYSKRMCDTESFRAFAQEVLNSTNGSRFLNDCHFLPQVEYTGAVVKGVAAHCKHVLKFEELGSSFDALMADYGIAARFDKHQNARNCRLSVPQDVKDLVKRYYAADYAMFGYEPN